MIENIHLAYSPTKNCKHPEWTYGEICVKCDECGRFSAKFTCINCGFTSEFKPVQELRKDWGCIEFNDGWFKICPKCKPLFKEEDQTLRVAWKCKMMRGFSKDFILRKEVKK